MAQTLLLSPPRRFHGDSPAVRRSPGFLEKLGFSEGEPFPPSSPPRACLASAGPPLHPGSPRTRQSCGDQPQGLTKTAAAVTVQSECGGPRLGPAPPTCDEQCWRRRGCPANPTAVSCVRSLLCAQCVSCLGCAAHRYCDWTSCLPGSAGEPQRRDDAPTGQPWRNPTGGSTDPANPPTIAQNTGEKYDTFGEMARAVSPRLFAV